MGGRMKNTLDIFNLNLKAFGLDISDQSLKLVQLEKKRRNIKIRCFNEVNLKNDIIKKGVILKPDVLSEDIKSLVRKTKSLSTKYIALSLPEERAFLQIISMPKMKEEELKNAVKYEAENYIPFSIEKMYLDCEPVSCFEPKKDTQEVLLAALERETADSYLNVLDQAGLSPLVLETESQAIARAVVKDCKSRTPKMIMDIGANRTIFIIVLGNTPRFSASIPLSANVFTEAVSKTLKIDIKKAEELKRTCGLKRQTEQEKEIFDALTPAMADLTEQIKRHLDYYHDYAVEKGFADKAGNISEMLICGGGSNLIDLDKFLSEQLGITVKVANPLINISDSKQLSAQKDILSFTVAIGLALRGLEEHD